MIRALYSAATGMKAQETNIDVVSNNLANVNTVGFKKSRADFQDLMYQYVTEPGSPTSQTTNTPSGISVGLGVRTAAVQRIFTQGDISTSGNQLDIAIEGDGFFEVTRPDGTIAYTRSGNFQLNENGQIVTPDGYIVSQFSIPQDAQGITVGKDGIVSYKQAGTAALQVAGTLNGIRFPNNTGLRAVGQNLYEETQSSGAPVSGTFGLNGVGRLTQGALESSNVSVVEQVVNMITAQRAYEASSKGITTADEMLNQAISLKR